MASSAQRITFMCRELSIQDMSFYLLKVAQHFMSFVCSFPWRNGSSPHGYVLAEMVYSNSVIYLLGPFEQKVHQKEKQNSVSHVP